MSAYGKLRQRFQGKSINYGFASLGRIIANYPFYFLAIPVVSTLLLSSGMFFINISRDQDWLYNDNNGKAARSRRLVETLFPFNTSVFVDPARITSMSNVSIVIVTPKDGGSVLREEVAREVATLNSDINKIEVKWRVISVNYSVLCGKTSGACYKNNLEEVLSNFREIRAGKIKIKYPFPVNELTVYYEEYISLLGGLNLDENGFVRDAAALRIPYLLDFSDKSKLEAINQWLSLVYEYISSTEFDYIDVVTMGDQTIYKSLEESMFEMLKASPYVSGTIMLFSALTCMSDSWLTSKPVAGICAGISAGLAIVSGSGLGFLLGIPYLDPLLAVFYIILAIEIDDAFILIACWRTTDPRHTVPERMKKTFHHAATSITITSLTNILSCVIGIAAPFPSFQYICAMTALCSFFAYVYLITFLGACLALSGFAEERKRRSALHLGRSETGFRNNTAQRKTGHLHMLWLKNNLGTLLTYPVAQGFIIAIFAINFSVGMWSWTCIKYGTDVREVVPINSSVEKFVKTNYRYFNNYGTPIHVIIKDTLNYADKKVQFSIDSLLNRFESHPHVASTTFRVSWLKYYTHFATTTAGKILLHGYNMSDKQDFIDGLRHVYLRFPPAEQFKADLAFNRNYTDIVASRFLLFTKDVNSLDTEARAIQDFYQIASKSEFSIDLFGFTFHVLEQAWIIKDVSIQTGCAATALCCLLFFAFSLNIRASLCVTIIELCVICELIGFLSLWGVSIGIPSTVVFLMSVGVSINHPLHMAFAFVKTNAASEEAIKNAIYFAGFPLLQGALSTILGLLVLNFLMVDVVVTGFKVICLISVLSLFHALFVIPVFLALFGVNKTSQ